MTAVAKQTDTPSIAAPFLKWAGGKRQLLPEIRKHVPEKFGRYFEPFIGGGAVYFDLVAAGRIRTDAYARLADSNAELIQTYELVRDDVKSVIASLRTHGYEHSEGHYYSVRARSNGLKPHAAAARMIYLNKTCFNGLYRVNRSGKFNVPVGRYENPAICDAPNLLACSEALAPSTLVCADFASGAVLGSARRGDFVYFDPPYLPVSETGDFTSFTASGFTVTDQERLVDCAGRLKSIGAHVLLSNADLPAVRKLYKGFEMRRVEARRNINSKAKSRGAVGELLIW